MKKQGNPIVTDALLEAVENQLNDLNPPETMKTYKRLLASGYPDDQARRLIAAALLTEINAVMKSNQPYNEKRYIGYLNKLPKLP